MTKIMMFFCCPNAVIVLPRQGVGWDEVLKPIFYGNFIVSTQPAGKMSFQAGFFRFTLQGEWEMAR